MQSSQLFLVMLLLMSTHKVRLPTVRDLTCRLLSKTYCLQINMFSMYTSRTSITVMQLYFSIFNSVKFYAALLGNMHLISCSHSFSQALTQHNQMPRAFHLVTLGMCWDKKLSNFVSNDVKGNKITTTACFSLPLPHIH